ncbi:MAG: ABC transporter substrate-binding protein [Bauldia sp.]
MHLPTRAIVFATATLAAALASPAMAQDAPVRVAIFNTNPFGGDPPGGYCFDLMTAIADRGGIAIASFQPMIVADMVPAITGGTADVLCSALFPSTERRQAGLAFTSGILTNSEAVVVLATNTTVYRSMADLAGVRVGAETGSNFVNTARNAGADVREFPSFADAYPALVAGEITAFIRSAPAFLFQQTVLGQFADLKVADGYVPSFVSYGAIAVRNTDTALLGALQASLEAIKADGTLAEIAGRWGMPLPPF